MRQDFIHSTVIQEYSKVAIHGFIALTKSEIISQTLWKLAFPHRQASVSVENTAGKSENFELVAAIQGAQLAGLELETAGCVA